MSKQVNINISKSKRVYYTIDKAFDIEVEVEATPFRDNKDNDEMDYDEPEISHSEWVDLFEQQHYTITGLLDELIKLAKEKQAVSVGGEKKRLQGIIDDATSWNIEEIVIENE